MRRLLIAFALTVTFAAAPISSAFAEGEHGGLAPAPEATMPLGEDVGSPGQPFPKDTPPDRTPAVVIVSSWPAAQSSLLAAPREGRLTFDKPVRPVDVSMQLEPLAENNSDGPQAATRTEFSKDLTTVRFALPLLTPGPWKLTWAAGESEGEYLFTIEKPIEAPGGGNHRHDSGLLAGFNIFERFALAALLVVAAAGLFWRSRRIRVIYGAAAAYITVVAVGNSLSLIDGASFLDNGTESLAKGIAAPGMWAWLIVAATGWTLAVVPSLSLRTRLGMLALVGLAHATALNVHTVAAKPVLAAGGSLVISASFIAAVLAIAHGRNVFAAMPAATSRTLTATEDAPTEDAPTEDAPTEDAPTEDAPTEHGTEATSFPSHMKTALVQNAVVFGLATAVSLFVVWSRSNFGAFEDAFATAAEQRIIAGAVLALTLPASLLAARLGNRRLLAAIVVIQVAAIAFLATPAPLAAGLGGESL